MTDEITPLGATTSTPLVNTDRIEIKHPSLADILPPDLANDPSLSSFKDFTSLAKSYKELKKFQGESIRIPTADSSAESRQEFLGKIGALDDVIIKPTAEDAEGLKSYRAKLGIPESEEDYQYQFEEGYKMPVDDEFIKDFNKFAKDHDLSKTQADKMLRRELEKKTKQMETQVKSDEDMSSRLKSMWGAAYEDKLALANQALGILQSKMGNDIKTLENSGALKNPAVLMMLADIGTLTGEKVAHGITYKPTNKTPADAEAAIRNIRANKEHPYWNNHHPDHQKAIMDVENLYKQADQANR